MDPRIETLTQQVIKTLGWTRERAVKFATETITRIQAKAPEQQGAKDRYLAREKRRAKKARDRILGPGVLLPSKPKKPLTQVQKLAKRLGPDDGHRRGGSPTVQGGSPGLGKRS